MLAVVDHEQHIAFGQPTGERIFGELPARPRQSELNRHLGRNEIGRPQRAQPTTVTPPGKSRAQVAATAIASAVLPTPPGPSKVVTGADVTLSVTSRSSPSLPTSRRERKTVWLGCDPFGPACSEILTRQYRPRDDARATRRRELTAVHRSRIDATVPVRAQDPRLGESECRRLSEQVVVWSRA